LFEQITPDCSQIVSEEICEFDILVNRKVLRSLQEGPATALEDLHPEGLQLARLLGTNLVDRLAEIRHNVEPVQDMDRVSRSASDHIQVRPPHVAAHEPQPSRPVCAEPVEEPIERVRPALSSEPEEPRQPSSI